MKCLENVSSDTKLLKRYIIYKCRFNKTTLLEACFVTQF